MDDYGFMEFFAQADLCAKSLELQFAGRLAKLVQATFSDSFYMIGMYVFFDEMKLSGQEVFTDIPGMDADGTGRFLFPCRRTDICGDFDVPDGKNIFRIFRVMGMNIKIPVHAFRIKVLDHSPPRPTDGSGICA
jgi:hypothetical protein